MHIHSHWIVTNKVYIVCVWIVTSKLMEHHNIMIYNKNINKKVFFLKKQKILSNMLERTHYKHAWTHTGMLLLYCSCLCCHSFFWEYVVFLSCIEYIHIFYRIFIHVIVVVDLIIERSLGWNTINWFIWISNVVCCSHFDVQWVEVKGHGSFCCIERNVDHHCLNFLFIIHCTSLARLL